MGKTADGAIWLDEELTSPYDFWQFWRNTDDRDVLKFLKMFTDLDLTEIKEISNQNINEQKNLSESKKQKESVIAKTEDNTNTKNQTQQTQSQTQANQNTIQKSVGTAKSKNNPSSKQSLNENKVNEKTITKKAKIKFSSFVSAVSCTGKYRNREFEPTWRVKVNANGRAESLEVLNIKSSNGKPMKMNSSDTKTLEIINKALLKSKFTPAKAGSTSVDSTTEITFKVPSYFCG